MWIETDHYIAPLFAFMRQGSIGGERGGDIYIVRDETGPVYVGKTTRGVYYRLWQHVRKASNLGEWLVENEFDLNASMYTIEVIGVDGDLDEAERHTITAQCPGLNIVNYKNKIAMPPIAKQPIEKIDLSYLPSYSNTIFSDAKYSPLSGAEDYASMDRLYAGLYSRAYRDPAHPDMRSKEVSIRPSTTTDVFYYLRTRHLNDSD